jgi:hypothetical protein
MKKKLQVFMSSTYTDMLVERQAAVEAILRSGHIPAGMELFAAGDESQWETIRRWIDDSDVFMLILGGRYGSIDSKTGKSYIQLEYEYATENKKPLFAAVISQTFLDAKVRSLGAIAIETDHGTMLKAFRELVTSKICRFFSDPNELKLIVFESLSNFERNDGLSGWIRGTDVIDPKSTIEEISRLQTENIALRSQLSDLESFVSSLGHKENKRMSDSINDDAKRLLIAAAKSDGHILYVRYRGGADIQAGNSSFIEPANSPREEARWKAALDELVSLGCVESMGYKGESFRVTKLGYEVADELQPPSETEQA